MGEPWVPPRSPPYTRGMAAPVELTALARAGGCAAKYSAARLEELVGGLVTADATDLLVGLDPADDAAVYRLDAETALVFTVDFFPPVVDDPRTFGRIAATNAINDVFAMGGRPLLALSVTAFPEELPTEMLGEVLAGARRPQCTPARSSPVVTRSATTSRSTARGRRHRPPGCGVDEELCAPGRRRAPDEAARHRARSAGRPGWAGASRRARGGDRRNGHAERKGGGCPSLVRTPCRHRRDGLRPAGARVRGRGAGARIELDAAAMPLLPGALDVAMRGSAPGATGATASSRARMWRAPPRRRSRHWPSTLKRPAAS